ncbi:hypothetical protein DMB44_08890 [Thermoplasma sp. Kam2015]|uniref:hypothetical protein n=1 Tax=Thermoplasma sp. Kam2015 TaxID=2094122 RepID=UPI000D8D968B|nr:hypothetical protein [Thermoplasma sp. Kam2015]PYB67524.1 hypothetical protein DMB44_08890 [Thermoplasma sp. Kam2015]
MNLSDLYIQWIYPQRWNIEIRAINGVLVQIFSALIAYILLLMMQSILRYAMTVPKIIRPIRHGMPLPV